jgi:hypothetical protein
VAADTLAEIDPRACKRTLERSEYKLISLYDVEANPEKAERLFQYRRDICKIGDHIGFISDERFDLRHDLFVDHTAVGGFRKCNTLGH